MTIEKIRSGRYVVAVSGGVDSVVLLHMLSQMSGLDIVVAHFNHGIRYNSANDQAFTQNLASNYGYIFETANGNLGPNASEDFARKARYNFLESILNKTKARSIITAHHQDDLIETAIINLIRGTGSRGLSSLGSDNTLIRPLLNYTKNQIYAYAKSNNLTWVEDETNESDAYLRNKVRRQVMSIINDDPDLKKQFVSIILNSKDINKQIENEIETLSQNILFDKYGRKKFVMLPDKLANEVIRSILVSLGVKDINSKMINLAKTHIKTGKTGSSYNIKSDLLLKLDQNSFRFVKS